MGSSSGSSYQRTRSPISDRRRHRVDFDALRLGQELADLLDPDRTSDLAAPARPRRPPRGTGSVRDCRWRCATIPNRRPRSPRTGRARSSRVRRRHGPGRRPRAGARRPRPSRSTRRSGLREEEIGDVERERHPIRDGHGSRARDTSPVGRSGRRPSGRPEFGSTAACARGSGRSVRPAGSHGPPGTRSPPCGPRTWRRSRGPDGRSSEGGRRGRALEPRGRRSISTSRARVARPPRLERLVEGVDSHRAKRRGKIRCSARHGVDLAPARSPASAMMIGGGRRGRVEHAQLQPAVAVRGP